MTAVCYGHAVAFVVLNSISIVKQVVKYVYIFLLHYTNAHVRTKHISFQKVIMTDEFWLVNVKKVKVACLSSSNCC